MSELNEIMQELSRYRYKSSGFPQFCLYYQPAFKYWSCYYRTPKYFQNPQIEAETPLDACKQMQEFLKGLTNGTTETNR